MLIVPVAAIHLISICLHNGKLFIYQHGLVNYEFVCVVPIDVSSEHLCYNISNIAFCRPDHFCLSGLDGLFKLIGLILVWSDAKIPTQV